VHPKSHSHIVRWVLIGKLYKTPFLFQNKIINCVQSYRYLGIIFTTSGTFTPAKNDLYQRALKGLSKLRKSFSDISSLTTAKLV
jgi:hypothetical protein